MYIIQYFSAQNALYEDFKKLALLLWSTVAVLAVRVPVIVVVVAVAAARTPRTAALPFPFLID